MNSSKEYERFSYFVEEYFMYTGHYPILCTYPRGKLSDIELESMTYDLFIFFKEYEYTEVIRTKVIRGEYWAGSYIELGLNEFEAKQNNEDVKEVCIKEAMRIHNNYEPDNCSRGSIVGFTCGDSVYAKSSLESLPDSFFSIKMR